VSQNQTQIQFEFTTNFFLGTSQVEAISNAARDKIVDDTTLTYDDVNCEVTITNRKREIVPYLATLSFNSAAALAIVRAFYNDTDSLYHLGNYVIDPVFLSVEPGSLTAYYFEPPPYVPPTPKASPTSPNAIPSATPTPTGTPTPASIPNSGVAGPPLLLDTTTIIIIAAAGGGGVLLIIIIISVYCGVKKRRERKERQEMNEMGMSSKPLPASQAKPRRTAGDATETR